MNEYYKIALRFMRNRIILAILITSSICSCDWIENQATKMNGRSSLNAIDTVLYSTPTSIAFADTLIDLGDVKQGKEWLLVYKYKNTGTKPLVLFNVSPSCGCTIADFSRKPLPPNGEDSIKAKFDSKGKDGSYLKNIKVNCNTEQKVHNLSFKVNVLK